MPDSVVVNFYSRLYFCTLLLCCLQHHCFVCFTSVRFISFRFICRCVRIFPFFCAVAPFNFHLHREPFAILLKACGIKKRKMEKNCTSKIFGAPHTTSIRIATATATATATTASSSIASVSFLNRELNITI